MLNNVINTEMFKVTSKNIVILLVAIMFSISNIYSLKSKFASNFAGNEFAWIFLKLKHAMKEQ